MKDNGLCFFGSANSGRGFKNYYSYIFKGLKKHYIIKGGSGTGKSSLMKTVAAEAENKGMNVERYYCSSDPTSLDGIIITDINLGISDGTSPHTSDPTYPGTQDEVIDLSSFWETNILEESREKIIEITNRKKDLYSDAYCCLGAALALENINQRNILPALNQEKISHTVKSITDRIRYTPGKLSIRLTEAITTKGYFSFNPYINIAEKIYNIKDKYGIYGYFFNKLAKMLDGCEMTVSYDPLDTEKINMIYLPQDKVLFCANKDTGTEINTETFLTEQLTLQNTDNIKTVLMSEAYSILKKAGEMHQKLEEIYISAKDFSKKEVYQSRLIKKILT